MRVSCGDRKLAPVPDFPRISPDALSSWPERAASSPLNALCLYPLPSQSCSARDLRQVVSEIWAE